jgi:SPP1 gp7 family putative phage head morphogenesis protein
VAASLALEILLLLFERAENIVEKEMLRALASGAESTATERRQRLAQIALVLTELRAKAVGTEEAPGAAWDVVGSAYRTGSDNALSTDAPFTETSFGGIHVEAARQIFEALAGNLDAAIAHVGRQANDVLRKVTLSEVLVGQLAGRRRTDTTRAIAENLRNRGVEGFIDKSGRSWGLTRYAQMAATTASAEASTTATLLRLAENGFDLVKWHVGAGERTCEICKPYENKVYSISGSSDEHLALEIAPPVHPNCRCVLTAHVEALSKV